MLQLNRLRPLSSSTSLAEAVLSIEQMDPSSGVADEVIAEFYQEQFELDSSFALMSAKVGQFAGDLEALFRDYEPGFGWARFDPASARITLAIAGDSEGALIDAVRRSRIGPHVRVERAQRSIVDFERDLELFLGVSGR